MDKIFWYILVLCGIWSQVIIGTYADEEIKETSDSLDRQKRVVSHVPGEEIAVDISQAPYLAYIKKNLRISCIGSILSLYVVITSAQCVAMEPRNYIVAFSSSRLSEHNRFKHVIEIRRRIGDPHHRDDGIGLVIVDSMFDYTAFCRPIPLYTGPLQPGTLGRIHGWGYNVRSGNHGTNNPVKLRSIEVPIIPHHTCVNRYLPYVQISDKDFCTYDPQRHSGHTDVGAGFVVDRELAGVFLWSGPRLLTDPNYPDVFVSLQDPYYNQWIRINLNSISAHYQNAGHH